MLYQIKCNSIWLYVYIKSATVFPEKLDKVEEQKDPAITFRLRISQLINSNNLLLKEITGVLAFSS